MSVNLLHHTWWGAHEEQVHGHIKKVTSIPIRAFNPELGAEGSQIFAGAMKRICLAVPTV
jgi:hypothetical protein